MFPLPVCRLLSFFVNSIMFWFSILLLTYKFCKLHSEDNIFLFITNGFINSAVLCNKHYELYLLCYDVCIITLWLQIMINSAGLSSKSVFVLIGLYSGVMYSYVYLILDKTRKPSLSTVLLLRVQIWLYVFIYIIIFLSLNMRKWLLSLISN